MSKLNLLDDDQLGKTPIEEQQTQKESPSQPDEHEQSPGEREQKDSSGVEELSQDAARVRIPRAKGRKPGKPPKKRQPQASPLSRGPSTSVIVFLLVVAIGVTLYFMVFKQPQGPAPVPVAMDTTESVVSEKPGTTTPPATKPEIVSSDTPIKEPAPVQRSESVDQGMMEKNTDEIKKSVERGKQKLESAYRLLSNISDRSALNFLSIGNEHLTLSAYTKSQAFANRVRTQITNTSMIDNIQLFDVEGNIQYDSQAQVSVYANMKPVTKFDKSRDLRTVGLSDVHHHIKEWIAIPTIELTDWNAHRTTVVDGWERVPLYIELTGSKTGIIRVIHAIKNYGYNVNISKIYVYSSSPEYSDTGQYTLKLYVALFGKKAA
mgnify:CR=1 FL=1